MFFPPICHRARDDEVGSRMTHSFRSNWIFESWTERPSEKLLIHNTSITFCHNRMWRNNERNTKSTHFTIESLSVWLCDIKPYLPSKWYNLTLFATKATDCDSSCYHSRSNVKHKTKLKCQKAAWQVERKILKKKRKSSCETVVPETGCCRQTSGSLCERETVVSVISIFGLSSFFLINPPRVTRGW